jgi:hypothetical protein
MRTKLLPVFILLLATRVSFAQTDSRVMIDTINQPAIYMEVNMTEGTVKDALDYYFDSMHIAKEKGKGFLIKKGLPYVLFKRAKVDYMQDYLDFYFVVDSKKQKGTDAATIYIAAASGYNTFITPDSKQWSGLKKFAEYLRTNAFEKYNVLLSINDLTKQLDKQRKKLADILKQKLETENSIISDSTRMVDLQDMLIKLQNRN